MHLLSMCKIGAERMAEEKKRTHDEKPLSNATDVQETTASLYHSSLPRNTEKVVLGVRIKARIPM